MTKVQSTIYPNLRVAGIDVRFVDGEADVTDEKALKRLRKLGAHGVVVGDDKPAAKKAKPEKGDGKGEPAPSTDPGEPDPADPSEPGDPADPADGPEKPAGNASTEDWATFAKAVGVEVDDDATRKQIVEAVEAAGK